MELRSYLKSDFARWAYHISQSSNPIREEKFAIEIFSDASLTRWGESCNGKRTGGFWNAEEATKHINELLAALAWNISQTLFITNKKKKTAYR